MIIEAIQRIYSLSLPYLSTVETEPVRSELNINPLEIFFDWALNIDSLSGG